MNISRETSCNMTLLREHLSDKGDKIYCSARITRVKMDTVKLYRPIHSIYADWSIQPIRSTYFVTLSYPIEQPIARLYVSQLQLDVCDVLHFG